MACETPFRDDSAQLLLFKIAGCLAAGGGGGGGVAGVTSFNLRTGVVTLTSGDVTTALGFTPLNTTTGDARYVLKSGDTMTGALTIGNGVLVANTPVLNLSQTWNNAAVAFTAFQSDVTATAAAAGSLLFNFRQNGVSVLDLRTDGRLTLTGRISATTTSSIGHSVNTSDALNTAVVNVLTVGHTLSAGAGAAGLGSRIDMVGDSATVASQTQLRIDSSWIDPVQASRTSSASFILPVSGTNVSLLTLTNNQAQLRDGTAALPSLTFQSDSDTGIYRTGANSFGFSNAGTVRWIVNSSGHLIAGADNTYDIGMSPTNRPRDLYFMGSLFRNTTDLWDVGGIQISSAAFFYWNGRSAISSPSDGVIRLTNNAVTDFNRLQFGGTTSSFPSIKRSAATLQFRLADDSAFAGIATAAIVMSTAAPLSFTSGANTRAGNAVLVAGTVTVANTSVTANTIVIATRKTSGGTIGFAVTYTVIAATSFTLTSDSALDTSTYSYILIENP